MEMLRTHRAGGTDYWSSTGWSKDSWVQAQAIKRSPASTQYKTSCPSGYRSTDCEESWVSELQGIGASYGHPLAEGTVP